MKHFYTILILSFILAGCSAGASRDFSEYREMAYSDIISPLVIGFSTHWTEFSPDESALSNVYGYESPYTAFAQADIDSDGSPELLIGDAFDDGAYQLYDIFTFDPKTLTPVHLLCGSERDSFVINGSGIIVETGSNSAFDSFTKYYRIEKSGLKEIEGPITDDLMALKFDKVLRYVAPSMYVAVGTGGETAGQLIKTFDDGYLVEVQDTVRISKEGVDIQFWSAYDGKGVVFPASPGSYPVFSAGSADSGILGQIIYESGIVPEAYPCKGYIPGWLKIGFNGTEGFVHESDFSWDFESRF